MDSFSIWHLIIIALALFVSLTPFALITKKAGYPWPIALLVLIPIVNLIFFWWLALSSWPSLKKD